MARLTLRIACRSEAAGRVLSSGVILVGCGRRGLPRDSVGDAGVGVTLARSGQVREPCRGWAGSVSSLSALCWRSSTFRGFQWIAPLAPARKWGVHRGSGAVLAVCGPPNRPGRVDPARVVRAPDGDGERARRRDRAGLGAREAPGGSVGSAGASSAPVGPVAPVSGAELHRRAGEIDSSKLLFSE